VTTERWSLGQPGPLEPGVVDVWSVDLRRAEGLREAPPDEAERARRFRDPRDGRRFLARRAALRRVLRAAAGRDDVVYEGKPRLVGSPVHFNLSSSGDRALIAVCDAPCGVDVERRRVIPDAQDVAEGLFTPGERAALAELGDGYALGFLRVWTRKEAFVKALGLGLGYPLTSFEVSAGPCARLLSARPDAGRWSLIGLDPDPEHVGALVVAAPARLVRRRRLMIARG
jgi:4'-phosphopantetheinyl transferase